MSIPHPHAAARRSQDRDLCTVDDLLDLVKKGQAIIDELPPGMDGGVVSELYEVWNKLDDAGGLLKALRGKVETR